ncbi:MAG: hypothetical protein AAFU71_08750 [Cyanobacteria bacterium J06632_22]
MLRSLLVTSAKLLCGLAMGGWIWGGDRIAIADEVDCYMTTTDGRTLSLSHICGADVPVGAYLADPEPVPNYTEVANAPAAYTGTVVAQPRASQPQRDVSQELPFLGALPPLPPMEEEF